MQSLKFRNPEKQKRICRLSGKAAKKASRHSVAQFRWRLTQTLYWQGQRFKRNSAAYQQLLDRAYAELIRNEDFLAALKATGNCGLVHTIGGHDPEKTVLTEYEFISRLKRLRQTIDT